MLVNPPLPLPLLKLCVCVGGGEEFVCVWEVCVYVWEVCVCVCVCGWVWEECVCMWGYVRTLDWARCIVVSGLLLSVLD